ncbi:Crp/Fnr family transcriptional regulator [Sphingobacterium siyangense]|uniref:Crp/Fnr family transcriptional regulator n=1 Tax=Sphingobacterium siyangense TaxID=459529 RepID=UPI003B8309AB
MSKTKKYKKGEFLLYQGEVCKSSFWIEEGITRKYYMNEKKEVTTELLFKHDLAVAFSSYVSNQPSREFIQAITDVTVSCMDKHAFQYLKINHPQRIQLDLLMTEYYTMWLEKRLFNFTPSAPWKSISYSLRNSQISYAIYRLPILLLIWEFPWKH